MIFNLPDYRVIGTVQLPGGARHVTVESLFPPGCRVVVIAAASYGAYKGVQWYKRKKAAQTDPDVGAFRSRKS